MAWEERGNNSYYYRKEWKNGKCFSTYVGKGEIAGLLAQLDNIDRAKRAIDIEKQRKNRQKDAEIDRNLAKLQQKTQNLVESFLINCGFYKTSSREWRLKAKMISDLPLPKDGYAYKLLKATNKPEADVKKEDVQALREYLEENQSACREIADFSGRIQRMVIEGFANSVLTAESYKKRLVVMRDNLGWNTASEIEQILIEQVCLCWLRLNFMEMVSYEKLQKSHSVETGLYYEKCLMNAQKRYMRACESLAKVRKLLAEADYREEQARLKRNQTLLIAKKVVGNGEK